MDAYYASVEQRDDPSLAGKPVIVGATGNRGVVCAANYQARTFGVHSAMPVSRARRLCPDGVYIRPRMQHYQEVSKVVFNVFNEFTPEVEGLSLDEAFLDVSRSRRLLGSMAGIGHAIKARMLEATNLVASVGMARNKFLAKLASDYDKPDGHFVIEDEDIHNVLDPLPIRRLWGIGARAGQKMHAAGIDTIGALRVAPDAKLDSLVGNRREHFLRLANGLDERPVVPFRAEKSVSHEQTFDQDLTTPLEAHRVLMRLSEAVGLRLRRKGIAGRTLQVKLRRADFSTFTRQRALGVEVDDDQTIFQVARALFDGWWKEQRGCEVRLLGVGLSDLKDKAETRDLFGSAAQKPEVDSVLDDIRGRFGAKSVTRARSLGDRK